jgi:hypothetical protein
MSKMVKVVCECADWDEDNLKVAEITSDWESTSLGWKVFHVLMCIPTGAFWVGVILAKMFISDKEINCLNCGEKRQKSDIRSI